MTHKALNYRLIVLFFAFNAMGIAKIAKAQTSIYRCETNGIVSFTNVKIETKDKPCRRVAVSKKKRRITKNDRISEKRFPKVDLQEQKELDKKRESLIRRELETQKDILEKINLQLTRFEIKSGSDQQQLKKFKTLNEKRRLHNKTVKDLEKQLSVM